MLKRKEFDNVISNWQTNNPDAVVDDVMIGGWNQCITVRLRWNFVIASITVLNDLCGKTIMICNPLPNGKAEAQQLEFVGYHSIAEAMSIAKRNLKKID